MGSSHQNVKQIALKLEKNGYMRLEKDERDKRVIKLSLTEKCAQLGASRDHENRIFFSKLISGIEDEEIEAMYKGLQKLSKKINEM